MNPPSIPGGAMQARILNTALIAGVVFFAIIAHFVGPISSAVDAETLSILRYVGFAGLAVAIVGGFVVQRAMRQKLSDRVRASKAPVTTYPQELFVESLLRAALFEGVALLSCIGYLLSHDRTWLMLIGVCVVGMLLVLPGEQRVRDIVEDIRDHAP